MTIGIIKKLSLDHHRKVKKIDFSKLVKIPAGIRKDYGRRIK